MTAFYITTPIYYVNDAPHLGHAYTTIAADALARFHRMRGEPTHYLTGTDEHGLKIEQAAQARGLSPQGLADEVVERFRATWRTLGISNDDFIRTTEPRHKAVVAEVWRRMVARGDVYLGAYEGWYCVSCEAYYPEGQLVDGTLCPTHKKAATWLSEPTYFFRMSRYQDALLRHFEQHPDFVQPENYKNEVLSFIRSGLRDLSVSRTTFQWGIPVPDDPAHVIYVWIDALTNYYSALSSCGGQDLRPTFWDPPATQIVHLIGKDILKFHAVYWPCMLMSAELPLPTTILCHGWWTVRGEKISKSMPATRVDPNQLSADLGADALRYFLLREVPLGLDGDFTYESLIGRYNAELANDLGNLVSRCLQMTHKFCDGKVPAADVAAAPSTRHLAALAQECTDGVLNGFTGFAPSKALEAAWRWLKELNRLIDVEQPWVIARDAARKGDLDAVLRALLEGVLLGATLIAPVMPETARKIAEQLGLAGDAERVVRTWPTGAFGGALAVGAGVAAPTPMFPRIDDKRAAALLEAWIPRDALATASPPPSPPTSPGASAGPSTSPSTSPSTRPSTSPSTPPAAIAYDDFARLDLRVAQVKTAEPVKGARKLLRLELDVGEDRPRQVVAGIAEAYAPDALVGKKVIFLANLKPATIRGVTSEGMILAAGGDQVIGLSAVDADVPPGTKIR